MQAQERTNAWEIWGDAYRGSIVGDDLVATVDVLYGEALAVLRPVSFHALREGRVHEPFHPAVGLQSATREMGASCGTSA